MTDASLEILFGVLLFLGVAYAGFIGLKPLLLKRSLASASPRPGTSMTQSGARLPRLRQSILDLEKVTVDAIMVPRNEVDGIDIEDDMDEILDTISNSQHTRLPVYKKDLNNVIGLLHMRTAARLLKMEEINKAELLQLTHQAYFIPESTPLQAQLFKFQKNKRRMAMVVDEYGDVQGIVTLDDILEEIVGEFTNNLAEETEDIHPQGDGSYLIDGATSIREINRSLGWNLSTDGPRTLNGLLTEMLENIPESSVGVRLPHHFAEIMQVKDNMIKTVRMRPVHGGIVGENSLDSQGSLFS